jgi:hypothetical protein
VEGEGLRRVMPLHEEGSCEIDDSKLEKKNEKCLQQDQYMENRGSEETWTLALALAPCP